MELERRKSATRLLPDEEQRSSPIQETKLLSKFELFCLGGFWFSYNYVWFLISIVLVPSHIERIVGSHNKGSGLAVVTLVAGVFQLFLSPIFGAMNDQMYTKFGKRIPFISSGILGMIFFIALLGPWQPLWSYTIIHSGLVLASIVCSVPFNALVSDVTHSQQTHVVSAVIGGSCLIGYLAGAITGVVVDLMGSLGIFLLMACMSCIGTFFTITYIKEPLKPHKSFEFNKEMLKDILRPLWTHRDFRLVFISRFLFQLGIASVQQYLQYWILDCVDIGSMSSTRAVSLGLLPNLLLSPLCAILLPKTRRKLVVYFSSCFMGLAALCIMFAHSFTMTLFISGLFGIGFGPFQSVEFAMLMDVLPDPSDAARDMSLWHSALILPQLVATPLAGYLLDIFQAIDQASCLGYKVVYGIVILYFCGGVYVTHLIQGVP